MPIVRPPCLCRFYRLVLALLAAASKKDHESVTIFAEIEPVARAEVDFPLEHAVSNAFHIRPVPCRHLVDRSVTLAAAGAFSPSNHSANGDRDC